MRNFNTKKLFLNLLILVCLGIAIWNGYDLFVARNIDIALGVTLFITSIGVLIWNISVLRQSQYRWASPSFKAVIAFVMGVVLILAFAGVQPLANYKDDLVDMVSFVKPNLESPEGTVRQYIKYWNDGRFDKIVDIVTPNLEDYYYNGGFARLLDARIVDYTLYLESLFGDYCIIRVTGGVSYDLAGVRTTEPYTRTFSLEKRDGKWLITSLGD